MYVVKHLEESLTSVTEGLSVRGLLVELVMKEVKATRTITMAIITTSLRINRMNSVLPAIKIPRNVCYRSEDYLWDIKSSLFLATQLTVNSAVQSGFLNVIILHVNSHQMATTMLQQTDDRDQRVVCTPKWKSLPLPLLTKCFKGRFPR